MLRFVLFSRVGLGSKHQCPGLPDQLVTVVAAALAQTVQKQDQRESLCRTFEGARTGIRNFLDLATGRGSFSEIRSRLEQRQVYEPGTPLDLPPLHSAQRYRAPSKYIWNDKANRPQPSQVS